MHGPVDGDVRRSSRISPSIAGHSNTVAARERTREPRGTSRSQGTLTLTAQAPQAMLTREIARIRTHTPVWLLPVAWMGLIMLLSTDGASAERTGRFLIPLMQWALPWTSLPQLEALHLLGRKAVHFTEYAVLGALWFRALTRYRSPALATWLALAIVVGWATLDEFHQFFVPSRGSSVADVALDTAGAVAALALLRGDGASWTSPRPRCSGWPASGAP